MYILKKSDKFDLCCIVIVAILYIINIFVKKHTNNSFLNCYFNDVLCPIIAMSYLNIMLSIYNIKIRSFVPIIILMLVCGIMWEYIGLNPKRVSDVMDIVCYVVGGAIYWFIFKIISYWRRNVA